MTPSPLPLHDKASHDKVEHDLIAVEELLRQGVRSQVHLADSLSRRLVQLGGKRLRPLLMSLTYHTVASHSSQKLPRATSRQLHTLASVAEWVHTATLFHDDVLDHSSLRRGQPCAHIMEGNKVAILVGDYVYAEAFALLMEQGLHEPSRSLAQTIKALVEGELLQHRQVLERDVNLETYERIARAKTASLFAWCCQTGAWAAGSDLYQQAGEFGLQLGFAFQMADDVLDTFELDPRRASWEDVKEWTLSAPPLPIVLLGNRDPQIQLLWSELPQYRESESELRTQVLHLQRAASQSENLELMKEKIGGSLRAASRLLGEFGHPEYLGQAVDLIGTRAQEGYRKAFDFQTLS